jgi:Leucine-rich repeat (LRR) protein
MKLSFRLLILFVFLALVLPKLLPYLGYRQAQNLQETEDRYLQAYKNQTQGKKKKFSASIDALGVIDKAIKKCLINELDIYTKMGPGSSGAISDIHELKSLRCDGYGIRSLDGIDDLTKLTQLSLVRNDIRSLYPLRYHPSLQSIDLGQNREISTIDVLSSIKTLKRVGFPRLDKKYCDAAKKVVDSMKSRHGNRASSNLRSTCRS